MSKKGFIRQKNSFLYKGLLLATAAGLGFLLISPKTGKSIEVPSYTAVSVFDGDTFETAEKQHIRLSAVDAPEMDVCGGKEAKKALENLILNKQIYIKIVYTDPYRRLNGLVYLDGKFINEEMLKLGYGKLDDRDNLNLLKLQQAADYARKNKKGIFSMLCTQTVNPVDASCNIKGNNPENREEQKFYHLPSCSHYDDTYVQLYLGDQWFCTEKEAVAAGYVKAGSCP